MLRMDYFGPLAMLRRNITLYESLDELIDT